MYCGFLSILDTQGLWSTSKIGRKKTKLFTLVLHKQFVVCVTRSNWIYAAAGTTPFISKFMSINRSSQEKKIYALASRQLCQENIFFFAREENKYLACTTLAHNESRICICQQRRSLVEAKLGYGPPRFTYFFHRWAACLGGVPGREQARERKRGKKGAGRGRKSAQGHAGFFLLF